LFDVRGDLFHFVTQAAASSGQGNLILRFFFISLDNE